MRWIPHALLLLLLLPGAALAGPQEAARLLSRYPPGSVPVEPEPMQAICTLGAEGGAAEISLLTSLAQQERAEVVAAALQAIEAIRGRSRAEQRQRFAARLPTVQEVEDDLEDSPLPPATSLAAAYLREVLGDQVRHDPPPTDPGTEEVVAQLLGAGQARKALAASLLAEDPAVRMLGARAREDLGDARGAVRDYASLAARGTPGAWEDVQAHGVEVELLLLGLLVLPEHRTVSEAEILEVLVRRGSLRTAAVLSERTLEGQLSARVTAADALGRMLQREPPLTAEERELTIQGLTRAAEEGPEAVRSIARDALEG